MKTGAKLIALFLLLIYATSVLASDYTLYRCKSDGVTRTSCCCSRPAEAAPVDTIGSEGCCDVHHVESEAAPTLGSKDGERFAAKLVASEVELPAPPSVESIQSPTRLDATVAPKGPPILRIKCSLLL